MSRSIHKCSHFLMSYKLKISQRFFSDIHKNVASFFFFFLLQSYKHKHVIIDSIQRIRPFTFALGSSVSDLSSLTALTFFSLCCQLSVVSLSLGFRYWKKKKVRPGSPTTWLLFHMYSLSDKLKILHKTKDCVSKG